MTSDAFLEALVACKDRACGPEFRWLPQAPPLSVAKAPTLLLNSVALYAGELESDAVVLFGWNLGIPRWAEATYGKLLEHTAHAQPSQVVVVVPTDFGFDVWKDCDGTLQEAVLQCFQERRRTVKVDLVSEDTVPAVSLPLPPHLAVSFQPSVERKPALCCRWSCSLSTTSASFSKSTQKLHCGRLGFR